MRNSVLLIFFLWLLATAFWWAFAFMRLPGTSPEWLEVARVACFGKTLTGLPDARGWGTLIFPPLFMLLSILFVFYRELKEALRNFLAKPAGPIVFAAVFAALLLEAGIIGRQIYERWPRDRKTVNNAQQLPETYPKTAVELPVLQLIDQDGRNFSNEDFTGKSTILTFAFANCETVCPMIVQRCLEVVRSLDRTDHQLVIVTLDPWRDTPSRLKAAIKMWQAEGHLSMLSGEVDSVLSVLDALEVPYQRDVKTGFVSHPLLVYVVNAEGQIAYRFNNPTSQWIKDALAQL